MTEFDSLGESYERSAVESSIRLFAEPYSMRKAVGDVDGLTVLDMGCGTGLYTRRLAQWGAAQVVGIDVSDGMLATARNQAQDSSSRVDYLRRDVSHPAPRGDPALDGKFDLVASVYALCYATTPDELTGFFTTARRSLPAAGGRLVAMTLNPEYSRATDYYSGYAFSLTQAEETDGAAVILDMPMTGSERIRVTARWWSREAYENAASRAGFTDVTWSHLAVPEEGIAQFGQQYWDAYLAAPHAVILTATA